MTIRPCRSLLVALALLVAGSLAACPSAGATVPQPVACRPAATCWKPAPRTAFFWQLTGRLDHTHAAQVYDVDAIETSAAFVRGIHARGRKAICYVSAGSYEEWRPDAAAFPDAVLGKPLDGWPGERWLDVRRLAVLAPILRARMDGCRAKGFDAIEFDNVDGWSNDTGFPLTSADQVRFNRWLANNAHVRGLAVGLKNDSEQVGGLVRWFDFAVVEECFDYLECGRYSPFVSANKAVFVAEYARSLSTFCPEAHLLRFTAARYTLLLDGHQWACPA